MEVCLFTWLVYGKGVLGTTGGWWRRGASRMTPAPPCLCCVGGRTAASHLTGGVRGAALMLRTPCKDPS